MSGAMIQPVPVMRDQDGWWSHPDIPDFDEDDALKYRQWTIDQGLTTFFRALEDERDDHPAYVEYFEEGGSDVSEWDPATPTGEGWFVLSIHDTEDGPIFVWATRTASTMGPGHVMPREHYERLAREAAQQK